MSLKNKNNSKLIVVESPTKAKTISKFLGNGYKVISSYGHVRDLPRSKLGVDVEKDFEPQYLIPAKAKPNVKILKEEAKKAAEIILAADEDREGEAIAWHIAQILDLENSKSKTKTSKLPEPKRIVFHEITKSAIESALEHPRPIDMKMVDAQQARRVLDRLVGYELSPFLWKKVMRGLSAGRVQSVAVRLVAEREDEIKKFIPQEYWTISAHLIKPATRELDERSGRRMTVTEEKFQANLIKSGDKKLEKFDIPDKQNAEKIADNLKEAEFSVSEVSKKETRKLPSPPFTTSTLQQEGWKKLRFSAKMTMMIAQQLYEGVEGSGGGLITYMRTDSLNLSEESLKAARETIIKKYGENFALAIPRKFKNKSKGAQEAHEAIRPTDPSKDPESLKTHLTPQQYKLYNLIWRRFIACQMEPAIFDTTTADILAKPIKEDAVNYTFRANGIAQKFAGFLAAYPSKFTENILPELEEKEELKSEKVEPAQHFTEPPPRYTEASLIKTLEEYGIGRPSTYAPTLNTIQARNYIEKDDQRRFMPTEIGIKVNEILVKHFPEIVDVKFTADMEEKLDQIAEGGVEWKKIIREFYGPFHSNLEVKYKEVEKENMDQPTDEVCEKCGKPMIIKNGRFGKFMACSGFPDCRNTKKILKTIGVPCQECGQGELVEKKTKKRRMFWGCSRYPECKYATWKDPRKTNDE